MSENTENTPKYSLKRKFIEVPIEREDGTVVNYEIRRASGEDIEAYLDENSNRIATTVGDDGHVRITQIKTYKGMFVSLLKRCLYLDGKLVPHTEIAKFPMDVQKGLFEDAQKQNGLSNEGAEEAKK